MKRWGGGGSARLMVYGVWDKFNEEVGYSESVFQKGIKEFKAYIV